MARVYANVNLALGRSWYDYEKFSITWSEPDRYEIVRRLGGGRYSEVFESVDTVNNEICAIKVLKPVPGNKIKREIKILRNLVGGSNIVALIDVVQDPSKRYHSLIMEYVENIEWKTFYPKMSDSDIKHYTFQLLKALEFAHQHGIMHRDVKPGNVAIDIKKRKLRLIDWGLAEFYHPGQEYHIRVGSRYYKAPELLVGYKRYDYSLDMWSVGCMLAAMIFRREHFFRGMDNNDQLLKILQVLGTERFDAYLQKYNIGYETEHSALLRNYNRQPWIRFVTLETQAIASPEAIDLLDKLLRYDQYERITALEAMSHVYFNSVRLEDASMKGDYVSDSGFCST